MSDYFRLNIDNLTEALEEWDAALRTHILVVACGGTALTLYGHKESTKDVDFLVPLPKDYSALINTLKKLGYRQATGYGYKHPNRPWLFDLFKGQTVFQTELLDPIHQPGNHRLVRNFKRLHVGCLNPSDLIITKMFRGTSLDVEDSVVMIKSEQLDMGAFATRYKETAEYYYNPDECKRNLQYLITEMDRQKLSTEKLREMSDRWNP